VAGRARPLEAAQPEGVPAGEDDAAVAAEGAAAAGAGPHVGRELGAVARLRRGRLEAARPQLLRLLPQLLRRGRRVLHLVHQVAQLARALLRRGAHDLPEVLHLRKVGEKRQQQVDRQLRALL